MTQQEVLDAVARGRVERIRRVRAAAEAAALALAARQAALPGLIATAQATLAAGALVAFIEEMTARGAVDAVCESLDPVLSLLGTSDVEVLVAAINGIEGARARMLGQAIEVAWDQPEESTR